MAGHLLRKRFSVNLKKMPDPREAGRPGFGAASEEAARADRARAQSVKEPVEKTSMWIFSGFKPI